MINNNNRKQKACTLYILLWMFGFVQDLFISSSLVSLLLYIPYLTMTVYYVAKVMISYRPKGGMGALCVFFVVLLCYGVALLLLNDAIGSDRKSFLMVVFSSLGPIFSFYVFAKRGILDESRIKFWFWPFLAVTITAFFVNRQGELLRALANGSEYEEITNNMAYFVVGLIPFVFLLYKKPIIQYLTIAVLYYFIITGFKRGAFISGAIMLLWFIYISIKSNSKKKKWVIILISAVILIAGYRFIIELYENSDYFHNRVEATFNNNSSNRNTIYSTLWEHYINDENVLQMAFGEGAYHTRNITGVYYAHNDWLELLIDCGFVTVFLYLIFWILFTKDWRNSKKINKLVYAMMGSCLIYTFTRTFFSMSFNDMPFFIDMIIGYCFANIHSESNTIEQHHKYIQI